MSSSYSEFNKLPIALNWDVVFIGLKHFDESFGSVVTDQENLFFRGNLVIHNTCVTNKWLALSLYSWIIWTGLQHPVSLPRVILWLNWLSCDHIHRMKQTNLICWTKIEFLIFLITIQPRYQSHPILISIWRNTTTLTAEVCVLKFPRCSMNCFHVNCRHISLVE